MPPPERDIPAALPDDWWRLFGDTVLDGLVTRAERHNTDIARATARLAQARALQQAGQAAARPVMAAQAGWSRQGGPLVNAAGDSGTLATALLGLSAEIDLSGRSAAAAQAATLDADAQQALGHSVKLHVRASVADAVLSLRALDAEARLLDQELQLAAARLRTAETRQALGMLAERELLQERAEQAERAAAAPELARRRDHLLHALAVLVGEPASSFELLGGLPTDGTVGAGLRQLHVPAGLPSQMLERRGDVQAAARSLAAAQARAGAAQAAWFPSLQLTASGGQASTDLRNLLQGAMGAWSLATLVALPLLDGGRRDAQIAQAQADVQGAEAAWREQVLRALREVEDQLSRRAALEARWALAQRAEASARRLADLAASRQRSGLGSALDAGRAQAEWLRSQQRGWQLQAERARATVALIEALGGGWGDPAGPACCGAPALALPPPPQATVAAPR